MISQLLAWLRFKVTPPIEFEFEFHSVRLQGDMPDFKARMTIDKFANCSTKGPVLELESVKLQSWSLTKQKDDSSNLYFQIERKIFKVGESDVLSVFNYFMNTLPHLWKREAS